ISITPTPSPSSHGMATADISSTMTSDHDSPPTGPDLAAGVPSHTIAEGAMLLGRIGGEAILVARRDGQCYAIGATCTHWSGPLADGILVGDTVRCPLHHACFSLKT